MPFIRTAFCDQSLGPSSPKSSMLWKTWAQFCVLRMGDYSSLADALFQFSHSHSFAIASFFYRITDLFSDGLSIGYSRHNDFG